MPALATSAHPAGDYSHAERWAARVVEQAIHVAHGDVGLLDAVDALQFEAEQVGLVDACGQDEIQAAMALAFGGYWA
jgi:hypothetical protein